MEGVVYTREWVVSLVLDMAGYTADADLVAGVIVEPSCGCGAFLRKIVERLLASAREHGKLTLGQLEGCICAYDVDPVSVVRSRELISCLIEAAGLGSDDAVRLSTSWVREGDALLAEWPKADWVVGNPPYVRASHIDRGLRAEYAKRMSCVTMGTDLFVGFFEKGLDSLKSAGKLCFICADRWLQNRYGARLRKKVASGFGVSAIVRMHGAHAFEKEVSAYPAITLLQRGGIASALRIMLRQVRFRRCT